MRSTSHGTKYAILTAALVLLLLGAFSGALAEPSEPLTFGTDPGAIEFLDEHGVDSTYTQVWAGAWLDLFGWQGFEKVLRHVDESGRTPVIQLYYWGNDLTEACFRDGCDAHGGVRKDQAGWDRLVSELTPRLQAQFEGDPVVIVLETEFNKHLRTSEELDEALARKADQLHDGYPNATVVLGFGNWGSEDWLVFDRAAERADEIGLQLMRGVGRDTPDEIRRAPEALLEGAQTAQRLFQKPIFVSDVAFSSHGGAEYEDAQADAIERLFEIAPQLREVGVHAIVYRSILDNPSADTTDYYGEAERHFGLIWANNKSAKPAFHELVEGLQEAGEQPDAAEDLGKSSEPQRRDGLADWLPFFAVKKAVVPDPQEELPFVEAWARNLLTGPGAS